MDWTGGRGRGVDSTRTSVAGDCLFYASLAWPNTCTQRPRPEGRDASGEGLLPSIPIWGNSRGSALDASSWQGGACCVVLASLVEQEPAIYCLSSQLHDITKSVSCPVASGIIIVTLILSSTSRSVVPRAMRNAKPAQVPGRRCSSWGARPALSWPYTVLWALLLGLPDPGVPELALDHMAGLLHWRHMLSSLLSCLQQEAPA